MKKICYTEEFFLTVTISENNYAIYTEVLSTLRVSHDHVKQSARNVICSLYGTTPGKCRTESFHHLQAVCTLSDLLPQ